jgi:hypothetical protein
VVYCRHVDETEDDEDLNFTPWTAEGAARLKAAASEAARALIEHAEDIAKLTSKSDFREVLEASDRLIPALLAVADAQFDYTGNSGPLGLVYGYDDDDDDDDDEELESVAGISVLQRRDYEVTDESAVITAGQQAYLRVWEEDTPEQAEADVTHIGRALYQIAHSSGSWESLDEVDGLRLTGGAVVVAPADEVLGRDPDEWPEALFEHDPARVLYTQADVYGD